jgi:hypothetical protein
MCLAARRSRIDPRQLSFSQVLTLVEAAWPKLVRAPTQQEHDHEFLRVFHTPVNAASSSKFSRPV